MATVKERTVKGHTYIYVTSTGYYKKRMKTFEKVVGPKDMDPAQRDHRIRLLSVIVDEKARHYKLYLKITLDPLTYLTPRHHFYLETIAWQYRQYLDRLYPGELEKYEQNFEVRYVHNTTAIEGNTLSLRDTELVLEKGMSPSNKELREIHEVENYKEVLKYVRSYDGDISFRFILKLHALIQRNIDDDTAGHFRRGGVEITGSRWEPPPHPAVEIELNELIDWYHDNRKVLNPFELAGRFHHRFLQIHPFNDGNGRVARELTTHILRKHGYPVIIIPNKEREDYMATLEKADDGDLAPLMKYFFKVFLDEYRRVLVSFAEEAHESLKEDFESMSGDEFHELQELIAWQLDLFKDVFAIDVEFKLGIEEAWKDFTSIKDKEHLSSP